MSIKTRPDHVLLKDGYSAVVPFNVLPFDTEDPRSLYNLVPDSVKACIEKLDAKFYKLSESELRRYSKPSSELGRLRLQFWDEYTMAQDQSRKMNLEFVIRNIYPDLSVFYSIVLTDPKMYTYMLRPPKDYFIAQREMLELGWEKLREVLEEDFIKEVPVRLNGKPILGDDGKPILERKVDHQLITKMIAITQMLDIRVKGAIVQKMQLESKSVNLNVTSPQSPLGIEATMEQLEAMANKVKTIRSQIEEVQKLEPAQTQEQETIDA